jgi:alkanesulfonate monooxygenase SsuD/methylene tetrahydromethanopterin reductase-like flavin-dependent oxidoreductase (luciferase family)
VADPLRRDDRRDPPGHAPGRLKPFRFGVNVWRASSRAAWAEKARKLEDLGYATLTVPDHLTDLLAPMPALISAAEATTRLRVGTNVLNNDFRHPVMVAREAATVDLLTEGRLQPGLGAGHTCNPNTTKQGCALMRAALGSRVLSQFSCEAV